VNDRSVMGEYVNGPIYNTLAWAFSVGLIVLTVVLVASTLPLGLKL
jgi:Mn2+/Fe2+ NRAMP family transporter